MKISIALSLLILGLGSVLGWRDHQRHATVRTSYSQLVAEAAQAGITPDSDPGEDGKRANKREREHEDKRADVRQVTADFIDLAKKIEAIEKKEVQPDEAMNERCLKIIDSVVSLNAAQLKLLIAEVRTHTDPRQDTLQFLISASIMALASDQPQAALVLFMESSDFLKEDGLGEKVISTSLAKWAQDDPTAALEWVRANATKFPDLVDDDAKRGLISGAATNDPRLAFQLIGELGLKDDKDTLRQITAAAKTPEEHTATLAALRAHLATLPEGEKRDETSKTALRSLAQQAAKEGFEAGSKWIESANLTSEEMAEMCSDNLNVKPAESGQWVEWMGAKLPGEKSNDSIRRLIRNWTEKDYQSAGKWLAATPAGPTKNTSIRSYAETVAKYEPGSAAQWALTLPPGQDRDETLKSIYQEWPENDDAAKQAFKKSHGIN